MAIKITKADVGRKVRLRNGKIRTIESFDSTEFFSVITEDYTFTSDGQRFSSGKSGYDIIAFADEPQPIADDGGTVGSVQLVAKAEERKTLRDEFAMAALTGLLAYGVNCDLNNTASIDKCAYNIADAMMAARESKTC